jgi:hypothetical protein
MNAAPFLRTDNRNKKGNALCRLAHSENTRLNRAATGDNASTTGRQTWSVDLITGALKKPAGSFCHMLAAVNHAGVTARGFPWLGRVPRDSKSAELVRKKRRFNAAIPNGFAVATD